MTTLDDFSEDEDPAFLTLLSTLSAFDLQDHHPARTPSPPTTIPCGRHPTRTPSPAPPAPVALRSQRTLSSRPPAYTASPSSAVPFSRNHDRTSMGSTPSVYRVSSPTQRGYTTEWAVAASVTQGVPNSSVRAVHRSSPHKRQGRKAAYVVFRGLRCGVYYLWAETKPLVWRVPNCIFRGYATALEARAAFAYAQARSWTCSYDAAAPPLTIPAFPRPDLFSDLENPLNGTEDLDDRWKCAELKETPVEEQQRAVEQAKGYQAKYRAKNRWDLRIWEALRRLKIYEERYGPAACKEYNQARYERKLRARERQNTKRRALEAYHPSHDNGNTDDGDCDLGATV
ncbi:hypothetical protein B0H15DRAFT_955791 [Mycena belliarum]|uniref:Ribonuclease H1 N-terminal domain-containing protein n=1 Tax=Mycena belliarum TaxID=1033014 RepID=A0AAD6TQP2_9AGAR|nr:hypothetical protein B0H15DRAFT_955791 [Mycena belliae]